MSWPAWIHDRAPFETVPQGGAPRTVAEDLERRRIADQRTIEREQAMHGELARRSPTSIGPPPRPVRAPFEPRVPLPVDAEKFAELARSIQAAGIPIEHDCLVARGKEKFAELLALNVSVRGARMIGSTLDLTDERSVLSQLAPLGGCESSVQVERSSLEQSLGLKKELEAATRIMRYADLLKSDQREARGLIPFWRAWRELVSGASLLRLGEDSRLRSSFALSGLDERYSPLDDRHELLTPWRDAIRGSFLALRIHHLLPWLLGWLSGDAQLRAAASDKHVAERLAGELLELRRPPNEEVSKVEAVLRSCLLGKNFDLRHDEDAIEVWADCAERGVRLTLYEAITFSRAIRSRFPGIGKWFMNFVDDFLLPHPTSLGYMRLDRNAFHAYVQKVIFDRWRSAISAVSLNVAAVLPKGARIVAAWPEEIIVESSNAKAADLVEQLGQAGREALSTHFPETAAPYMTVTEASSLGDQSCR